MRQILFSLTLASLLCISSGAEWCYLSQVTCESSSCKGPKEWNKVHPDCAGDNQSPINIITKRTLRNNDLMTFTFTDYDKQTIALMKNNGHSVQVSLPTGKKISGGNLTTYKALQFHLHWGTDGGPGSEHTIDGEQFPMELHIVHIKDTHSSLDQAVKEKDGIAVLGFFYQESPEENKNYTKLIDALDKITDMGLNTTLQGLRLDELIPAPENLTKYYRYEGSLTTPDCSEAVVWTVFENPIPLSKEQILAFTKLNFKDMKSMVDTFRPVQKLNNRIVYRSGSNVVVASMALLAASLLSTVGVSWLH
ncbi:carbonic anhydrase 4a [Amia ocellicauda]|uniref:carbonic anhydrase 4a n=1 Tax=Amia ocellicauda TaxID=2972642 RepID=UPI0034647383